MNTFYLVDYWCGNDEMKVLYSRYVFSSHRDALSCYDRAIKLEYNNIRMYKVETETDGKEFRV